MLYLLLIVAIAVVDQIIKYVVANQLGMGNQIEVIKNFFYIHCIPNHGIAFGKMENMQPLVITVTAALMIGISVYIFLKRKKESPLMLTILAMIVGGGVGNIIDRILLGYVVDYLDFRVWSYIFNFADICVVVGCFAMMGLVLFDSWKEKETK